MKCLQVFYYKNVNITDFIIIELLKLLHKGKKNTYFLTRNICLSVWDMLCISDADIYLDRDRRDFCNFVSSLSGPAKVPLQHKRDLHWNIFGNNLFYYLCSLINAPGFVRKGNQFLSRWGISWNRYETNRVSEIHKYHISNLTRQCYIILYLVYRNQSQRLHCVSLSIDISRGITISSLFYRARFRSPMREIRKTRKIETRARLSIKVLSDTGDKNYFPSFVTKCAPMVRTMHPVAYRDSYSTANGDESDVAWNCLWLISLLPDRFRIRIYLRICHVYACTYIYV